MSRRRKVASRMLVFGSIADTTMKTRLFFEPFDLRRYAGVVVIHVALVAASVAVLVRFRCVFSSARGRFTSWAT